VRKIFAGLAALQVAVLATQFFLAASGAFDTAPNEEAFQPHRALGFGIVVLAMLLTILAALARMPRRIIGMTGLIVALAAVQGLIRAIASALADGSGSGTGRLVFGLHAVNALVIFALAMNVARSARALSTVADRPVS
jgi:Family of unknown function (DUF6220)